MADQRRRTAAFRRLRLSILRADPTCWLCHEPIDLEIRDQYDEGYGSIDHVVPIALGGSDARSNLRPAHLGCNRRRQAKPAHEVARLKTSRVW